jgi:hypothetical protein
MGNRFIVTVLVALVVLNLVLFYEVFQRDVPPPAPGSAPRPITTATAGTTGTTRPSPTAGRTSPSVRSGASPARTPTPSAAGSPTRTVSPAAPDGTPPGRTGIQVASTSYAAEPFETVRISGRYPGVRGRTRLVVEQLHEGAWRPFPLPTTTTPSGRFTAFVELGGRGTHVVRVVDPDRRETSAPVTVTVG